jgi:hypothetical protein
LDAPASPIASPLFQLSFFVRMKKICPGKLEITWKERQPRYDV